LAATHLHPTLLHKAIIVAKHQMLLGLLNCVEPNPYDNQEARATEEEGRDTENIKNPKGHERYTRKEERTG
tara:strand:- start:32 stop:244 length:213 start_codon:yes stop_codon:yes gene_type:complete